MEQILYFNDNLIYRGYDNDKRHAMSEAISKTLYILGYKEEMSATIDNNVYKLHIKSKKTT